MKPIFKSELLILTFIFLISMGWKGWLISSGHVPFNADEAVVGLMARHILKGERPVFFYGQNYMGSLDAGLVSLGFTLFGEQIWVIRVVQSFLYLGLLLTTYYLGKDMFSSCKVGLIAAGLLSIPTVNMTLYTTVSLGGYGEALLLGNLILLLTVRLLRRFRFGEAFLWGGLAGLGLWANALTMVYVVPGLIFLVMSQRKTIRKMGLMLLWVGLGGFLGASPWWWYAVSHGGYHLITELTGSAVSVEQGPWLVRSGMHLIYFLLLGLPVIFGLRPPWAVEWLAFPLIPFALAGWGILLVESARLAKRQIALQKGYWLLLGVGVTLIGGFVFTAFGVDPSGRYFLPLAVPLALMVAAGASFSQLPQWLPRAALMSIMSFQVAGNLQAGLTYPPGLTTQFDAPTILEHRYDGELIRFLQDQGETRGYTHYWVAYPLAFQSSEALIFIPRLPYHTDLRYTSRDDRYAPYNTLVESSPRVAYITTNNPALEQQITDGFRKLRITWKEKYIGDYHIFYALSQKVTPEELGIGEKPR